MKLEGKAWKLGRDVDTDQIIPGRYCHLDDVAEAARHTFEDVDPEFVRKVAPGDMLVAGSNFGCGSSRELAPLVLKEVGVSCVIAASFARIFYRNAINIGLPILESAPAADAIAEGHLVAADLDAGTITDRTTGEEFAAAPFPAFLQDVMNAGGLLPYAARRIRPS